MPGRPRSLMALAGSMPSFGESYAGMIAALAARFGTAEVGPTATDPFERMVAVLLGRTLDPRKVARAVDALRDAGLLEPSDLAEADPEELAGAARLGEAILPAPRCALSSGWRAGSSTSTRAMPNRLDEVSTDQLREELLGLNGIGPASADAMLLLGARAARLSGRSRRPTASWSATAGSTRRRLRRGPRPHRAAGARRPRRPGADVGLARADRPRGLPRQRRQVRALSAPPYLPEGGPREPE